MNWIYNKNVIVTGASSGIGKEICKLLAIKYNCKVLGVARTESKLLDLQNEIKIQNKSFDYYCMDVGNSDSWRSFKKNLLDTRFMPDILINNAGTMPPFENFSYIDENTVERVYKTNFFSVTYSVRELIPLLLKSKSPAIINISSAGALSCMPGVSIYDSSKSALKTFSETLHCELKGKVYISTIMPGFAKTNLFSSSDNNSQVIDEKDKILVNHFCMAVEKMAKKIVRVIKHKKARAIIGFDAKSLNFMYKIAPQTSGKFIGFVMKKSKLNSFDKIFDINKIDENMH